MITKETMERFVKMLKANEIVVVARRIKVNYEMKVIGVHNGLKWDFTPMVAYVTSCRTNGADITHKAVRDISPESIIWRTLKSLPNHQVSVSSDLVENFPLTCFYM